jgi:hypothetical protein
MTYIYLKPVSWRQSIRRYPSIDANGLYLSAECTTDSDFILSDRLKLRDRKISLSFLRGVLPEKIREETKLSDRAIGGIWWLSDDNFVHGWFYLPDEDYAALWDQIKGGDYIDCHISLGTAKDSVAFTGGEFAWKGNPISVDSAEVSFNRKAIKQDGTEDNKSKPTEKWPVAGSNRYWAVILILMAMTMWYAPQWNGLFFEPLKDFTGGEARIASTILFVGGLLLWFTRR